jgi:IS5 family transposase
MDYSFLCKCFKAIRPETWKRLNEVLVGFAVKEEAIEVTAVRTDTTVVEGNIHYPTDSSLCWDGYRVLTRLLREVREYQRDLVEHRFHDRKVKRCHLFIARYHSNANVNRQRRVRKCFRMLVEAVDRVVAIAQAFCRSAREGVDGFLLRVAGEMETYLPAIQNVLRVTERAALCGETVPASERTFSIFEQHVELLKRTRAHHDLTTNATSQEARAKERWTVSARRKSGRNGGISAESNACRLSVGHFGRRTKWPLVFVAKNGLFATKTT